MFRDFFKSSEKVPPTPEERAQAAFRADHAAFFHALAKANVPVIDATIQKYGDECLDWKKSGCSPLHYVLRKNKILSFVTLLDHGANAQEKIRIEGDISDIHMNVLEHALFLSRPDFVYALIQRRDNLSYRAAYCMDDYTDDALVDLLKTAYKIRHAYKEKHSKAPADGAPAAEKTADPAVPVLKRRISKLEKALGNALARIQKLENPDNDNTLPLDKPHYPSRRQKPQ